jgi:hypothetical protein
VRLFAGLFLQAHIFNLQDFSDEMERFLGWIGVALSGAAHAASEALVVEAPNCFKATPAQPL